MLWASQWEPERAALAYRHLDTVLDVGLIRADGSSCHAAALDPQTRAVTGLFSLQGWSNSSMWARGQAWAMLGFSHAYEASRNSRYLTRRDWQPIGMSITHRKAGYRGMTMTTRTARRSPTILCRLHCNGCSVSFGTVAAEPSRALSKCRPRHSESSYFQFSDRGRCSAAWNLGANAAYRAR